jgi:hypothetical protein
LPTVTKVVNRTPDPIWPAPDAPDVKKARTKPKPQQQQQQQQQDKVEGAHAKGAKGNGAGSSKGVKKAKR